MLHACILYIEMPRKITASHILFVDVSVTTSKGFALYGCTHSFEYKFWGKRDGTALLSPSLERITFMGGYNIVAELVYCEIQKCIVKYRRLGSVSKGFIDY